MQYEAGGRPKTLEEALAEFAGVVWINPYQMEARIWGGELALGAERMIDARRFLETAPPDVPVSPQWHRLRRK